MKKAMSDKAERRWWHCTERCFAVAEEERCVDCPSRLPQAQPKATPSPYDLSGNPTKEYPGE